MIDRIINYLANNKLNIHRIDNVSESSDFQSLDINITSQEEFPFDVLKLSATLPVTYK